MAGTHAVNFSLIWPASAEEFVFFTSIKTDLAFMFELYTVCTSLQGGYCIHSFVVYGFVLHLFQCADMQGV